MLTKPPNIRSQIIDLGTSRSMTLSVGEGPSVVLIPSMMVRAQSYREPMLELAKRGFHVMVIEAPGSGNSKGQNTSWSFDQYGDWCAAILAALSIQNATLIAHSNSGPVAMLAATRAPQRVARLVLADSVGADRSRSLVRILAGRALDALLEPVLSITRGHHVILNVLRHWRNFWRQVLACAKYDAEPAARAVSQPTLLAWGRHDHTMSLRSLHVFEEQFPRSVTYLSEKGSHDWLITNAEEFAEAVLQFSLRCEETIPSEPPLK